MPDVSAGPLVLASASPRRLDLLRAAGFVFEVFPADVDETPLEGEPPETYVARVAAAKSAAVVAARPGAWVVGADTAVVVEGRLLGKPVDGAEAAAMLRMLSGREHEVLTGVSVRRDAAHARAVERTRVRFAPLSEEDLRGYVATGEPAGKAGGYAIQGRASAFVERIEGSYANVVGLPVGVVCRLLRALGFPAPDPDSVDPGRFEGYPCKRNDGQGL